MSSVGRVYKQVLARTRWALTAFGGELWNLRYDPLPPMSGPRLIRFAPQVLVCLLALYTISSNDSELSEVYGLGDAGAVLAFLQSGALLLAMFYPIPAWWLVTGVMVCAAVAGESHVPMDAAFPWTGAGMVLQGAVLFLVALRSRPRVVLATLLASILAGVLCGIVFTTEPHRSTIDIGALIFAAAATVGTSLRASRVARLEVMQQQVMATEERTRRQLLEDRQRIARELHDVVAHHMSVISIQAQVAPHLVKDPPPELLENLTGIRGNAVAALTELRRVLGVLRSGHSEAPLAPQPGIDRIPDLVDNVEAAGVRVDFDTSGTPLPLPPGLELSVFRIAQEAMSNAMRHAPGASIRLTLGYGPDRITIRVVNTEPTSPSPVADGTGHGLPGMRERVAMLGGDLATGPTPDGGYEVTAVLPVTP